MCVMNRYLDIKNQFLETILEDKQNLLMLLIIFLFGSLILIIPANNLMLLILILGLLAFLAIKPEYCFYLIVFSIPFTDPLQFGSREIPLNQTDFLIFLALSQSFLRSLIL